MSNNQIQSLMEPVHQSKRPRLECSVGTVAPSVPSKTNSLPQYSQDKSLAYRQPYLSCSLSGQDLLSPWSPSTIIGKNVGSPAALASEGSISNPLFYNNGTFLVDDGSPAVAQDVSSKHNFAFCSRSPNTHSPSGSALVSPVAVRKVPMGCANSSHSKPENSVGLAIPKPVYGHNPCCAGPRCTVGPNFAVERGLQRFPHQMFEDDRIAYYGHWTYLNKEPEALRQQRLLPFEHSAERQSKDISTEDFHGFRASRPRHVTPLSDPSQNAYMYGPVHSMVPSLPEHCQRFQMATQMHKDLVPMYNPVTGMHYTTHMQVYQDCPHFSNFREIPQPSLIYCQKDITDVYSPENSHLISEHQMSRRCPVLKPQDSHNLVLPGHLAVRNPAYPVHRMNFVNAANATNANRFCPPVNVQPADRPLDFSVRRDTNVESQEKTDRQHQISGTFHQTESQDQCTDSNGGDNGFPISRCDYTPFCRYSEDLASTNPSHPDQKFNPDTQVNTQIVTNDDQLLNKFDQQMTTEFEPSSPPMPVINKVFSLAPYKAYLEATGVLSPVQEAKCPQILSKSVLTTEEKETSAPNTNSTKSQTESSNDSTEVPKVELKKEIMETDERSCQSELNRNPSPVIHHTSQELRIKKEQDYFEKQASLNLNIVIKTDDEPECKSLTPTVPEPSLQSNAQCSVKETRVNTMPSLNSDAKHTNVTSTLSKPPGLQPMPQPKFHISKIPLQCLKLTNYKIILPEVLKTPTPETPVPEVPKPPCELKPDRTGRKAHHQFMELHQSLCRLLSSFISQASHCQLKDWILKMGLTESALRPAKNQKVSCLLGSKARDIWMKGQEVAQALQKVLGLLESYVRSRECPFPHVIRAGAVFIPMLVVKEILFSQVQGNFIDQVLQEHHVELRPTTLSEERQLTQLHKRAFSSKLRRLLSLKHLPDVYLDVLNLLYYSTVCKVLGVEANSSVKKEHVEGSDQAESTHCKFSMPNVSDTASSVEKQKQNSSQKRSKSKGRVKSACKRIFLRDDYSSAEDEPVEESQTWSFETPEGEEYKGMEADCTLDEGHIEVKIEEDTEQEPENSFWGRPLTSDDLSSDGTEMETETAFWTSGQSCISCNTKRSSLSKKHSSMVLKLKKVYYTNSSHGQVSHYKAVGVPDQAEAEGKDRHRLHHRKNKIRSSKFRRSKHCSYSSSKCASMKRKRKKKRKRWFLRSEVQNTQQPVKNRYPDLVGKRICHLYEENDKTEVWYRGVVLRIHEANPNPLKTVFEVKYDSEPEWQYYLELLVDYQKGWLKIET